MRSTATDRICIVGDFDADGATGTAVAVRGLRLLGARDVRYRVPNRFTHGYGLSPGLVDDLAAESPDLIVTVDNGVACHAGVAAARARGMQRRRHRSSSSGRDAARRGRDRESESCRRCVSEQGDRRRRRDVLPAARVAREPARARALRGAAEPDLSPLLDLVALGTVADLVPLDANNRVLVAAGLRRIRAGRACAGIAALCRVAGRDMTRLIASDLAFALAPRINAAGRLDDMRLGIECLLTDDPVRAAELAERLSTINAQRRDMQATMVEQGEAIVAAFLAEHGGDACPHGVVLFESGWHAGRRRTRRLEAQGTPAPAGRRVRAGRRRTATSCAARRARSRASICAMRWPKSTRVVPA